MHLRRQHYQLDKNNNPAGEVDRDAIQELTMNSMSCYAFRASKGDDVVPDQGKYYEAFLMTLTVPRHMKRRDSLIQEGTYGPLVDFSGTNADNALLPLVASIGSGQATNPTPADEPLDVDYPSHGGSANITWGTPLTPNDGDNTYICVSWDWHADKKNLHPDIQGKIINDYFPFEDGIDRSRPLIMVPTVTLDQTIVWAAVGYEELQAVHQKLENLPSGTYLDLLPVTFFAGPDIFVALGGFR